MIHSASFFCLCLSLSTGVFGTDEVKSVSVTEGDSVSLNTDVNEVQRDDQILWMFGPKETRIAEIIKRDQINFIFVSNDGRFRDKLQMDNQTGSLTVRNIRSEHSGLYKLQIISSKERGTSYKRFNVSVYAPLPVPDIIRDSLQCSSSSGSSGQNCSLLCSVLNVGDVTLSWYKGNSLLSSISVSDLSISLSLPLEVEYQENNIYSCVINNPITNHTTHLDISQLCLTCSDIAARSSSHLISLIVVISVAVGSVLIVAAVVCIRRKHRNTGQEVQAREDEEEITYAETTFYKRKAQKPNVKEEEDVVYAGVVTRR